MPSDLPEATVAIVGAGLMGGSLGKALVSARSCKRVVGLVRRPEAAREAVQLQAADAADTDPGAVLGEADLVVLAAPVRTIEEQVLTLHPYLKPGAVLTDMGSVKRGVVQAMAELPPHVHPVGGHPMCGKETPGIRAADPLLFKDKVWVLTPLERSYPEAVTACMQLIAAVGARPIVMDAAEHDATVACISHLPYLLASSLVGVAEAVASEKPRVWDLASSGFRDTSRVAAGDLTMMMDILRSNDDNVVEMLKRAKRQIDRFIGLLEYRDDDRLRNVLAAIRERRAPMFRPDGNPTLEGNHHER